MTILSTRAVAELARRHAVEHGGVDLAGVIHSLRKLDIPDHRIRAGLARAVDSGRLTVTERDGRPTLTTAQKEAHLMRFEPLKRCSQCRHALIEPHRAGCNGCARGDGGSTPNLGGRPYPPHEGVNRPANAESRAAAEAGPDAPPHTANRKAA